MALNLLNNIDHGVLPAGSIIIKNDLALNNLQYGTIGSAVFAGLTVGKFKLKFIKFRLNCSNICLPIHRDKDNFVLSACSGSCISSLIYIKCKFLLLAFLQISHWFLLSVHFDLLPSVG